MKKYWSVQYLRAVAALLVVVNHAQLHAVNELQFFFVRLGSFGVLLFFVISGFIMVTMTSEGRFDGGAFLRRRIERVVPLYWLATAFVAMLAVIAPDLLKNTSFSIEGLVKSLLFIPYQRGNGEIVPLLKLGWTLNYEMFFYLLFAAFCRTGAGFRVVMISAILAILAVIGIWIPKSATILFFFTRPVALSFAIGMVVGLAYQRGLLTRQLGPATAHAVIAGALVIGLGLTAAGLTVLPGTLFDPRIDLCFALAASAFIAAGLIAEPTLYHSRLGLALGDASYSIYLVHLYVVALLIKLLAMLGPAGLATRIPIALVFASLAGLAIHRLVERPIMRFFQRWRQRLDQTVEAGTHGRG
ncbi:MAG: acyltransferase [Sphingomonas sp.]|jgi:exopolysaccharide production protein ExoZ|nr:acyltransferase [Sphingomonas sp.]